MNKKAIQMKIEDVTVLKNGRADVDEANNQILLTLYYPSPGKPTVTSIRSVKLVDRQLFRVEGLDQKLVFKEEVIGDFALGVSVTSGLEASKFEKAISKALEEVLKTGLGKIPAVGGLLTGLAGPIAGFQREHTN